MALDLRDKIASTLRNLVSVDLPAGERQAKVVAVASSKGGVGKTTTSVNLAVALAKAGHRVLLVDLDPQAHVAAALQKTLARERKPLSDVLLGKLRDVYEVASPTRISTLWHAGSDKSLAETEMLLSTKIGKELLLADALEVARTHFDVIVLDCPPNLGTLTLNALCAADHLLVPSDMSVLALEGVSDILSALTTVQRRLQRGIQLLGIIPTRVDARSTAVNEDVGKAFRDLFGNALLRTSIPQSAPVNRAHMAGCSVLDHARTSPGAKAYGALAAEVSHLLQLDAPTDATAARKSARSSA